MHNKEKVVRERRLYAKSTDCATWELVGMDETHCAHVRLLHLQNSTRRRIEKAAQGQGTDNRWRVLVGA